MKVDADPIRQTNGIAFALIRQAKEYQQAYARRVSVSVSRHKWAAKDLSPVVHRVSAVDCLRLVKHQSGTLCSVANLSAIQAARVDVD